MRSCVLFVMYCVAWYGLLAWCCSCLCVKTIVLNVNVCVVWDVLCDAVWFACVVHWLCLCVCSLAMCLCVRLIVT